MIVRANHSDAKIKIEETVKQIAITKIATKVLKNALEAIR